MQALPLSEHGLLRFTLAEAHGHKPFLKVGSIEDLQFQNLTHCLTENLDVLIQRQLSSLTSDDFELGIYFGRNIANRCSAGWQLRIRLKQIILKRYQ